jgi:hypothetical protein
VFLWRQQTFGMTPTLHPLRRTESDRDLAYLIRTLLRFSAQRERWLSSPTSWAAASREKPGSAQSRSDSSSGGLPSSDRLARLVAKDPGSLLAMSRGGDRGKVHTRTGRKPYPSCLAGGSNDRTVQLWDWPPPVTCPVRLLVNRCGSRRSSGNTYGPCLRLPLHCQACQRSLTRKRSLSL